VPITSAIGGAIFVGSLALLLVSPDAFRIGLRRLAVACCWLSSASCQWVLPFSSWELRGTFSCSSWGSVCPRRPPIGLASSAAS
jgi:hypothetical protein